MSRGGSNNGFDSLRPSDRAHNLLIGEGVEIHDSAEIGPNVVIHDNVVIGENVILKHNVVVGARPTMHRTSRAERFPVGQTRIEKGAVICINSIVMAGVRMAPGTQVGDQAVLRENVQMGEDSVVGGMSGVGVAVEIGARVRIQNVSIITPRAVLEEDAFIGPGVNFTTDNTLAREGRRPNSPIVLRRACRLGAGVTLTPGVEIGEEAFVAAGAVVTRDVGRREKIRGVPGRVYGTVADEDLLENWR